MFVHVSIEVAPVVVSYARASPEVTIPLTTIPSYQAESSEKAEMPGRVFKDRGKMCGMIVAGV